MAHRLFNHDIEYWRGVAVQVNSDFCTDVLTDNVCAYIYAALRDGCNVYDVAADYGITAPMVRWIAVQTGLDLQPQQHRKSTRRLRNLKPKNIR